MAVLGAAPADAERFASALNTVTPWKAGPELARFLAAIEFPIKFGLLIPASAAQGYQAIADFTGLPLAEFPEALAGPEIAVLHAVLWWRQYGANHAVDLNRIARCLKRFDESVITR